MKRLTDHVVRETAGTPFPPPSYKPRKAQAPRTPRPPRRREARGHTVADSTKADVSADADPAVDPGWSNAVEVSRVHRYRSLRLGGPTSMALRRWLDSRKSMELSSAKRDATKSFFQVYSWPLRISTIHAQQRTKVIGYTQIINMQLCVACL